MFIIWGFRARKKKIAEGVFFCPREGGDRTYVHRKAKRWFTLYFIPLIPLKDLGEYVECSSCESTFYPNVLQAQTNQNIEDVTTIAIRHVAVNILRADGVVHDSERSAALEVVKRYASRPYEAHDLEADLHGLNPSQLADNLEELGAALSERGKESVVMAALLLSAADGSIDQSELDVVRKIGEHLTMTDAHINGTILTFQQNGPPATTDSAAPPQRLPGQPTQQQPQTAPRQQLPAQPQHGRPTQQQPAPQHQLPAQPARQQLAPQPQPGQPTHQLPTQPARQQTQPQLPAQPARQQQQPAPQQQLPAQPQHGRPTQQQPAPQHQLPAQPAPQHQRHLAQPQSQPAPQQQPGQPTQHQPQAQPERQRLAPQQQQQQQPGQPTQHQPQTQPERQRLAPQQQQHLTQPTHRSEAKEDRYKPDFPQDR